MADEKQDDFWNNTKEIKTNAPIKKEEHSFVAMDEDLGSIQLSKEKVLYKEEGKVQLRDVKLFKMEEQVKEMGKDPYTPFFITVEFADNGKVFEETYRGGRIYEKEGKKNFYIGPNSAMGKLKKATIDSGVTIGPSVKTWIEAIKNHDVIVKAQTVQFGGKDYEKNYVQRILE